MLRGVRGLRSSILSWDSGGQVVLLRAAAILRAGPQLGKEGEGICASVSLGGAEGNTIRVPFVAPGETVAVDEDSLSVLEVVEPSPVRVTPRCPLFTRCNGCQLQHVSYAAQLQWKREQVESLLQAHKLDTAILRDTVASPREYGYRSKLTPHFRAPPRGSKLGIQEIGFQSVQSYPSIEEQGRCSTASRQGDEDFGAREVSRGIGSGESVLHTGRRSESRKGPLVDVPSCPIAMGEIDAALPALREKARGESRTSKLDGSLFIRALTSESGEVVVVTDTRAMAEEAVLGNTFRYRAGEFFQNNPFILPILVHHVLQQAKSAETQLLVDAYCGVGLFSVCGSELFRSVVGVEISSHSVKNARENAKLNDKRNCNFISADACEIFRKLGEDQDVRGPETAVIVDPPRSGCSPDFLKQLIEFSPGRIVYVSCNPETQARDLAVLVSASYKLADVTPFDLFPQTKHIESVATLVREG